MAGDRKKALDTLHRILPDLKAPPTRFTLAYCAALTYASIDRREEAFTWLETARQMRDTSFPFFPSDARFDALKTNERLCAVGGVDQVGRPILAVGALSSAPKRRL